MTNEQVVETLKGIRCGDLLESGSNTDDFARNPQNRTTNDTIYRQAAIDASNAYLGLSQVSRTIRDMISVQDILERLPSAQPERNGWVHIDDIYRLISGHSNYHGDNILAALTCLAEGKEVTKPITVLDAQPEKSTRKLIYLDDAVKTIESFYRVDSDILRKMTFELKDLPSAQPDLSVYSDRLWEKAYANGYARCKSDAIDLLKKWSDGYEYIETETESAIKELCELPSTSPEIIRCENCRNRDDKWEDCEEDGKVYWCDMLEGRVKADNYCSYAEKRVGEAE